MVSKVDISVWDLTCVIFFAFLFFGGFLYTADFFEVLMPITLIGCSGAIGGLAFALASDKSHTLNIPFRGKQIDSGFIGDMIMGSVSAVAGVILISMIAGGTDATVTTAQSGEEITLKTEAFLNLSELTKDKVKNVLTAVAVSVLCGFYGLKLLSGLSEKLFKDLSKRVDKVSEKEEFNELKARASELIQEGNRHVDRKEYRQAVRFFKEASEILPSPVSYGKLAFSYAELSDYESALSSINKGFEINEIPEGLKEGYHWNRACYLSMLNQDLKTIISDIKIAINMGSTLDCVTQENHLEWAKEQDEFKNHFNKLN